MKAIVQSCDRYHSVAENMLTQYERLWPSNPFTFRLPWNIEYPKNIESKFKDKVEFIKTEIPFKETFNGLTEDLGDDEWVYWCIDDKYVIDMEEDKANKVFKFVESIENPNIINVSLSYAREQKQTADYMKKMGIGKSLSFEGLHFIEHRAFTNNWLHQFFRVGALKEFWSHIKEPKRYQARSMDHDVRHLTGVCLVLDHKMCTYGESTDKGSITKNCENSCIENNITVPDYFLPALPSIII